VLLAWPRQCRLVADRSRCVVRYTGRRISVWRGTTSLSPGRDDFRLNAPGNLSDARIHHQPEAGYAWRWPEHLRAHGVNTAERQLTRVSAELPFSDSIDHECGFFISILIF
jgi:hypothetical protein